MEKYIIRGGNKLQGEVSISGAKNAAVAILPAVILSDEPCIIENVPNISDIDITIKILLSMGAEVTMLNKSTLRIDPRRVHTPCVEYDLAKNMRVLTTSSAPCWEKWGRQGSPCPAAAIWAHVRLISI